jgi:hypothetical protein
MGALGQEAFTTSRSDSWTGWVIGLAFLSAGGVDRRPGSTSLESTLLAAIAKTYLLIPVAALVLVPVLVKGDAFEAAREDGPKPSGEPGTPRNTPSSCRS